MHDCLLSALSFLPVSYVSFLYSAPSPELSPDFALCDCSKTWIGLGAGSSDNVRSQEPSRTSRRPDAKSLAASREGGNRSPHPHSVFCLTLSSFSKPLSFCPHLHPHTTEENIRSARSIICGSVWVFAWLAASFFSYLPEITESLIVLISTRWRDIPSPWPQSSL
jgi:hypothetical protein